MVLALDLIWLYVGDKSDEPDPWQPIALQQIDLQLSKDNFDHIQLSQLIDSLQQQLGLDVQIGSRADIQLDDTSLGFEGSKGLAEAPQISIGGQYFTVAPLPLSNQILLIGPEPKGYEFDPLLVTLLFYAFCSMFIWYWVRPLVLGLDQLTAATRLFSENYGQSLPVLQLKEPVQELASSFSVMALKIQTLIQTQSELAGGLSHELRTPLARIKFALATANAKLGNRSPEELESIEQDVQELEKLVDTMLNYSRLQNIDSTLNNQIQWLPLDALSLDALAEKYRWRTSANICVVFDSTAQPILCDKPLLILALSNLISNACRYAKTSIQLSCVPETSQYRVIVEDDGPGIAIEKRDQATEPFQKVQDEAKSDGFGLGLAIVARIAQIHGGELRLAQSELGGLSAEVCWPKET